jgi:hypothetical protein
MGLSWLRGFIMDSGILRSPSISTHESAALALAPAGEARQRHKERHLQLFRPAILVFLAQVLVPALFLFFIRVKWLLYILCICSCSFLAACVFIRSVRSFPGRHSIQFFLPTTNHVPARYKERRKLCGETGSISRHKNDTPLAPSRRT